MDAQNMQKAPAVMKESKNKIKVDFERTPLKERLKAKFGSLFFLQKVVWFIFRLVLLVGISYVILFPFFSKISGRDASYRFISVLRMTLNFSLLASFSIKGPKNALRVALSVKS